MSLRGLTVGSTLGRELRSAQEVINGSPTETGKEDDGVAPSYRLYREEYQISIRLLRVNDR